MANTVILLILVSAIAMRFYIFSLHYVGYVHAFGVHFTCGCVLVDPMGLKSGALEGNYRVLRKLRVYCH